MMQIMSGAHRYQIAKKFLPLTLQFMAETATKSICFHCGEECLDEAVLHENKSFCCPGCKLVYEILTENNLCSYYDLNKNPGNKNSGLTEKRFNFLDEEDIIKKLITFRQKSEIHITLYIPSMHCSSCIWLLENFNKINPGVIKSEVNFIRKEIRLVFNTDKTSLRKIVEQLTLTGYEPSLQLDAIEKKEKKKVNRGRVIRIGVAGFCFANIMMLSFPEYFSSGNIPDPGLKTFFSYVILLLSLPAFFYSASEFFVKSYRALKHKSVAIDIPIAIGIAVIFLWSVYEILFQKGPGYLDSGSGLVFFMLIGRWFQDFTFDSLVFDRNFKSYFPISVTRIKNGQEQETIVNELQINDRILIRNNEIIPVDGILLNGQANINYQFVTGESLPVHHEKGETIFAGGKQEGSMIELMVTKEMSASNLSALWNNVSEKNTTSGFEKIVEGISRWFIVIVLLIAVSAGAYWFKTDIAKAIRAFSAVLIIACPCALALSAPFTYGNILRILGRNKIYLRNYNTLERLADINVIVFDKTGTLTRNNSTNVRYDGAFLSKEERKLVCSAVRQSTHPLSRIIHKELGQEGHYHADEFREETGKGIHAIINKHSLAIGRKTFEETSVANDVINTRSYITIDGETKGYFSFRNEYRPGIKELSRDLQKAKYSLAVLTGDNNSEFSNLKNFFSPKTELRFNQSPSDKLSFVRVLHEKKLNVMMVGDGLNDAGALRESDVGISITENTNSFTPASDVIADASKITMIPNLLKYSKSAVRIIIISFIISLLYNFVGLSYAVTGNLSPLVAAILMPISTISLVLFTVISSKLKGRALGFR